MKIVYVTPRVPYPPNKGDKIRNYHHLRHLSRHHEVHLVSLTDRSQIVDSSGLSTWSESFASVSLVPVGPLATAPRLASALATGTPLVAAVFSPPQLQHAVRLRGGSDTDLLWICNGALAPALTGASARHRVVDLVDADSDKWQQMAERHSGLVALLYRREARLTRAQETAAIRSADACLVVSAAEARQLDARHSEGPATRVVTSGVDLDAFPLTELGEDPEILFTGALDYAANIDAVLYFATEVLPGIREQIPAARFLAAGSNPSRRLHRAARRYRFQIAADVADIRPYFARARAAVAPIRIGRGLQTKVLEAMASGVPVVATPIALAGLAPWHEPTAVQAETPADLVAGCVALMTDRDRALNLAATAHRFVAERHNWDTAFDQIDAVLQGLDGLAGPPATGPAPDAGCAAAI